MRITLVEDNESLAAGVANRLRDNGHAVDVLHDGRAAMRFLADEGADLVVLDINLPGASGLDVLRDLRARMDMTPVILLTARGSVDDRVAGLDAGADDYLVKPFDFSELDARLRALARRRPELAPREIVIGEVTFDLAARRIMAGGADLGLPRRELAVFECLAHARGRIVSKQQLLDQVYGVGADVEDRVVEVYVSRLRKRIAPHGVTIKTARGIGYLMDAEA